eukprot:TRINITY_DN54783_c0_g1_i1.p1 TRINITY_DN54783_c0_g1~~TRINITY_DN54783_c0_g1_i1.p1  ORF type:complete len:418 (+),score=88.81 TRINITY_DN54783_c0_g1_i1:75-1328(+)
MLATMRQSAWALAAVVLDGHYEQSQAALAAAPRSESCALAAELQRPGGDAGPLRRQRAKAGAADTLHVLVEGDAEPSASSSSGAVGGTARLEDAAPIPCDSWLLVWYAQGNWETNYVPQQLLDGVRLRGQTAVHECKCKDKDDLTSCACEDEPLQDCTIAVVRGVRHDPLQAKLLPWLDSRYAAQNLRRAYVMIGEEEIGCGCCVDFYQRAPLVLRNYFHEDCSKFPNVLTVPLGRTKGHEKVPEAQPLSQRRLVWSFSSDHKLPVRDRLSQEFVQRFPADSHLMYPGQDAEYMETLCSSKFVLAPRGGTVEDTWRLDEALACGAIPVVTDGGKYFARYMPWALVSSFLSVDESVSAGSMDKVHKEIEALLKDPKALDERGRHVTQAWRDYQQWLKGMIAFRLQQVGAGTAVPARTS